MRRNELEYMAILDFGSQYTQLIARRIREQKVFCHIFPYNEPLESYVSAGLRGIILSGGPASVFQKNAPLIPTQIFELGFPVLGICYGLQLIAYLLGGKVAGSKAREYGHSELKVKVPDKLFKAYPKKARVWMSHGDSVVTLPKDFKTTASTQTLSIAALANEKRRIYGVQFHPEVAHTYRGERILKNFLFEICKCSANWTTESFIRAQIEKIRKEVNGQKIICGLSGGIDSSVCALLVHKAVGNKLTSIFVDNGLLRKNEADLIKTTFKKQHLNFIFVDARQKFLEALANVIDPEQKRKVIGRVFIEVFEQEAFKLGQVKFLAQGTLYPDLIESKSFKGPSATIKSHHNVGGLPEQMNLKLIEPLKELFKDEVRKIGQSLNLPDEIISRHPFPGPGLAVRVLGEVTKERLDILREADEIFLNELKKSRWYEQVWQAFCVLLPIRTVGVMGDERTYENVVALRSVISQDGMTADWAKLPYELIGKVSNRIINEVRGVNRVVYDVSSKPPATIEWE